MKKSLKCGFIALGLTLALLDCRDAFSQIKDPAVIPPTPNVASIAKYGDIPIGLYTGQPNIYLPLYEIKYNDFSMPISLSYNYTGLKVEDYPGWVGTGWTLNATGVITRQTRGLADERTNGFNGEMKRGKQVVNFIESGTPISDPPYSGFLQQVIAGSIDTEPDMFVFSIPGHSGKFFFDETQCDSNEKEGNLYIKHAILTPDQKISVRGYFDYPGTYNFQFVKGVIRKFEITDEKGVAYLFDVLEKASINPEDTDDNVTDNTADYGNAWYLSKITTPFNNNIYFHYRFRPIDIPATVSEQKIIPYDVQSRITHHFYSTTEAILDKIIFDKNQIEFVESNDVRQDWNSGSWQYSKSKGLEPEEILLRQPKSLDHVKVIVEGKLLKQFNFKYGYFGWNARLRLDSFQEVNEGVSIPPYQFFYQDGIFPKIGDDRSLFNQDHWGYYTDANLSTLLPPFFAQIEGDLGPQSIQTTGNLRTPVPQIARAGLLKKIVYPTGGTTSFEYEPNDFFSSTPLNFVLPKGNFVNLASASAQTFQTEVEDRKTVSIDKTSFVKLSVTASTANCGEGATSVGLVKKNTQEVVFWYIISRNGSGGKTTSQSGPNPGEVFQLLPGEYELVAGATVESSCSVTTPAKANIALLGFVVDKSGANYTAGGFRVSKVVDCSNNDPNGCIQKTYTYTDPDHPEQSSGALINSPAYAYIIKTISAYPCPGGPDCGTVKEGYVAVLVNNSLVPIAGTQGGVVGYRYVTVNYGNNAMGGRSVKKFTSAKEFPDVVFYEYPAPLRIDYDWKRGIELSDKSFKNSNGNVVAVNERKYMPSYKLIYNRNIGLRVAPRIMVLEDLNSTLQIQDYFYKPYSLTSGRSQLDSESTVQIFDNNSHTVTSRYFYENPAHRQITRTETTDSDGDSRTTKIKYPEDVNDVLELTPSEIQGIKSNPNKTAIIEKQQFTNGKLITHERNLYDGPKLMRRLEASGGNSLEEVLKIDEYDSRGNPLSYTTRNGEIISFIYDANKYYPIAKVANASQDDIFYTSFEDDGVEYKDSQNQIVSKTGSKVFNSGVYVFPVSFNPPDQGNLVMTYWHWSLQNGWRFSDEQPFSSTITTTSTIIDEIRVYPKRAQMTTYTYKTGIGLSSVTDTNNKTSYYEYDRMNRLKRIKDDDGNTIKNYEYGYKLR